MSYPKERYSMPSHVELSAPGPLERANSLLKGWVWFYEIAFKIGLRLPFHNIINMVLNFYNVALGQLMPNSWRYLLGLIVLSESRGLQIDMAMFMYFFYMKPNEEGRYTLCSETNPIRCSRPPTPTHDKGKKQPPPSILGLEDSSTIRSDTALVDPIVDSLLTRHDHSILKEMSLDKIGLEVLQSTLKEARYLYNAIVKVNKAYKRKAETYNNVVAANKALEEDNHSLKKTAMNATKRAEQLERKWSKGDLKLIEKDKKLDPVA
ncbi:hypothetical protein FNV43_RR01970 [Rhamnella rubrinervis]|uniref:Transposase (putative) gypsy type domain-containing protein n=1 Tax=Rhamnella rubrinervis TaxID=2594499 RepID=A0A8K0MTF9_9ROSA|nr:hypothetical protein FNV43_RR01970 [Rhamnella rubrinervis]